MEVLGPKCNERSSTLTPLGRVSKGETLRTGHRSARGVAQDAPFLTAARPERRAGALIQSGGGYVLRCVRMRNLREQVRYSNRYPQI
jgi:hypothetical protein